MAYYFRITYGDQVISTTELDSLETLTKTLNVSNKLINSNFKLELYSTGLPSGYTAIEYIKAERAQWLDLGTTAPANARLEIQLKFEGTFAPAQDKTSIFSSNTTRTTTNSFGSNFGEGSSTEYASIHNWFRGGYVSTTWMLSTTSEILNNKNWFIADRKNNTVSHGSISRDTETGAKTASDRNIYILASNTTSPTAFSAYNVYLYEIKLYDNDTLIRDLIPCKNNSSIPGMYDTVGKTFYKSASSTAFIAGPEV